LSYCVLRKSCDYSPSRFLDINICLPKEGLELAIGGNWEHYATVHNVLSSTEGRIVVMGADYSNAFIIRPPYLGPQIRTVQLYRNVDLESSRGRNPDIEFIDKLAELIRTVETEEIKVARTS